MIPVVTDKIRETPNWSERCKRAHLFGVVCTLHFHTAVLATIKPSGYHKVNFLVEACKHKWVILAVCVLDHATSVWNKRFPCWQRNNHSFLHVSFTEVLEVQGWTCLACLLCGLSGSVLVTCYLRSCSKAEFLFQQDGKFQKMLSSDSKVKA